MAQRGAGSRVDNNEATCVGVQLKKTCLKQTSMDVLRDNFDSEKEDGEDSEWHENESESQEKLRCGNATRESCITEILIRRTDLIMTDWVHEEGQGVTRLRKEAVYLGLAVSRSSERRICFYPRGQNKIGKTFLSFSRTKKNSQVWVCTGDVEEILKRWEEYDPLPDSKAIAEENRSHKMFWSAKALKFCMDARLHNDLTYKQIAGLLNNQNHGYLDAGSRHFTAVDVANKLRQVFPRELDLHHMMQTLHYLKKRDGWQSLHYMPDFVKTMRGTTLRSIVITLPNAARLVDLYGHCIHTDATFGVLIYGHLVGKLHGGS